MSQLAKGLTQLGFIVIQDFLVRDDLDGNGPYVAYWNAPVAMPSRADINTAAAVYDMEQAAKASREAGIRADTGRLDLLQKVNSHTRDELFTFIDNQIAGTTVAQLRAEMRAVVKRLVLLIALDKRD